MLLFLFLKKCPPHICLQLQKQLLQKSLLFPNISTLNGIREIEKKKYYREKFSLPSTSNVHFSTNILQLVLFWVFKKMSMYYVSCYEHKYYVFSSILFSQHINFVPFIDRSQLRRSEWPRDLPITEPETLRTGRPGQLESKLVPILIYHTSSWVATIPFPHIHWGPILKW